MTFRSELFWMNQRVEEVDAEANRRRQAYDRFAHRRLLEPSQGVGVEAHEREQQSSNRDKDNVRHGQLQTWSDDYPGKTRKRSIWKLMASHKEVIRRRGTGADGVRLAESGSCLRLAPILGCDKKLLSAPGEAARLAASSRLMSRKRDFRSLREASMQTSAPLARPQLLYKLRVVESDQFSK
jgi:hypothetical protein